MAATNTVPTGRPKGTPNKATKDVRLIAQGMLRDAAYRQNLMKRLRRGQANALEPLLWQYAYGKPKTKVELSSPGGKALQVHFYLPDNHRETNPTEASHDISTNGHAASNGHVPRLTTGEPTESAATTEEGAADAVDWLAIAEEDDEADDEDESDDD